MHYHCSLWPGEFIVGRMATPEPRLNSNTGSGIRGQDAGEVATLQITLDEAHVPGFA